MQFYLLDHSGAETPRFSFSASGPKDFRAAISSFAPHDFSPDAAQWRRWGGQSLRRAPEAKSWWYTVAADMPADNNRPWCLFSVPSKPGMFVETYVGVLGAAQADHTWRLIVEAVNELDSYLRKLNGLAKFCSDGTSPPRPSLRLVD